MTNFDHFGFGGVLVSLWSTCVGCTDSVSVALPSSFSFPPPSINFTTHLSYLENSSLEMRVGSNPVYTGSPNPKRGHLASCGSMWIKLVCRNLWPLASGRLGFPGWRGQTWPFEVLVYLNGTFLCFFSSSLMFRDRLFKEREWDFAEREADKKIHCRWLAGTICV